MKFPKSTPSQQQLILIILSAIYLICGGLQSFPQHFQYLTNNWDLGFHNQLVYHLANFEKPSTTLWKEDVFLSNSFGDHCTFLMLLNAMSYYLFGSYSLLVCQILYGLIGLLGIYKLIQFRCNSTNLALVGVLLFISHYSLYSALDFDAHDNVYGMMFLPWILCFYYKNNFKLFLISLIIFLLAREDLSLTSIMLGITIIIFDYKENLRYGIACFIISLLYFIVTYKFIIPALSPLPDGHYNAWRFGHIGGSITDIFIKFIKNPLEIISILFDKPEKIDKWKLFLSTGGILLLIKPKYLLLAVPTIAITCLSNDWSFWGNMYHYNILFAVLLPFVVISTSVLIKSVIYKRTFLFAAIITYILVLNQHQYRDWKRFKRIFTYDYYHQRYNMDAIREGLSLIPSDAAVSASNNYTPHLAGREKVYFYPDIKDAEYIFINEDDAENRFFPFANKEEFRNSVNKLKENKEYGIIFEKQEIFVLLKVSPIIKVKPLLPLTTKNYGKHEQL